MARWTHPLLALALLLAPSVALAGVIRADLAEAYGAWQPPEVELASGPHASAIGLDIQVPRHLGCVRTRDPSTGVTVRCATDPAHHSVRALGEAQRATEGGVRPIVFQDLGSVLAMRLRDHLEQRFAAVDVDRGPIPVTMRLKYDIHGGRFGERDMRVELEALLASGPVRVTGHSRERLPAVHLAWFVPTLPLAGTGLVILDRVDREAIAAQAVATVDDAAAKLAQALAEAQIERGLRPAPAPLPEPQPLPAAEPAPSRAPALAVPLPKRPARCEGGSASRLSSLTSEAMVAFVTHDGEEFERASDRAAETLLCVDELLLPPQVAAFHRLVGLRAWYDGDRQAAELAFRASLALEPSFALPERVAPSGGPLRASWDRATEAPRSRSMTLEPPAGVRSWVDGGVSTSRPLDLPSLVQLGSPPDRVGWTAYLAPGARLPDRRAAVVMPFAYIQAAPHGSADERWGLSEDPFPDNPLIAEASDPQPPRRRPAPPPEPVAPPSGAELASAPAPRPQGGSLLGASIGTGAAAAALYGTAVFTRTRFDRAPSEGLMMTTNACYLGAVGLGVTSATLGTLHLTRRPE
jgi:hypothetical protein